jgi:energy-coupling factor transporter ATP-binding protein EcfA2
MRKLLPNNYPMYDTVYGNDIPSDQYFVIKYDTISSKYGCVSDYDIKIINYFILEGFKIESSISLMNKRQESRSELLLVNDKKRIMVRVTNSYDKSKSDSVQIDITYDIKRGEIEKQLDFKKIKEFEKPKKKASISLVKSEMGHLDVEDYDLLCPEMNLELNYGSNFLKIHDVIVDRLNRNYDKGIILLHGDPGTGKTSYIKHLTSLVKEKNILFIPPSMAEMLSEPSIIPFLMDHKNSILIIEDAERVISDREGNGSPAGVSNILNLTDGILGDCLNIQVIATFNMKREKIDQALLRKGRLIAEHKFEKLNTTDTNKLLIFLDKDYKVEEGMVLADIYNIDVEVFKTQIKNKIGFNQN